VTCILLVLLLCTSQTATTLQQREAEEESTSESDDSESSSDEGSDVGSFEFAPAGRPPLLPATNTAPAHMVRKPLGPATLKDPFNPAPAVKVGLYLVTNLFVT
jgi:hypothetical protein